MKKIKKIKYSISTDKNISKRLIHISDLHYYKKKDLILLNRMKEEIKDLKPNYILITGDFIDHDKVKVDPFIEWMRDFGKIAPIFLSIGNHDTGNVHLRSDESNKIFRTLNRLPNIEVLDNKKREIDNICITGVTIPDEAYHENKSAMISMKRALQDLKIRTIDTKKFNIVLCHSPYIAVIPDIWKLQLFQKSDLILSGHTHGGLTPKWLYDLLGKRSLLSPVKRPFPRYSQGYYKEYHLIINSAVKKLAHSSHAEFFDRFTFSEITVIDINK